LRAQADVVARANVDLLVCDEAHRLKNATQSTKGAQALASLKCHRRVLLTGTPIQNNLDELWGVMDFAAPGLLGDLDSFRKIYSGPIEKASERGAKEEVVRIGNARREEVGRLIGPFIHSRKADEINASLLPPKTEYVVFVRLSEVQKGLYVDQLKQKSMLSMLGRIGKTQDAESISPLQAIQTLQKLCNAAALATEVSDPVASSSKLAVLRAMFRALANDERIVVVSGFTTTLDLIAKLCESEHLKYDRLQGSTPPKERTSIVRTFNNSGKILLLSTKAGGVGLNLVGANRLVLVDSSWNPAHDLQAQARVWREGQTKPCSIYRLLSTGTIEERMFQRQELKGALARTLGFKSTSGNNNSAGSSSSTFTQAELRDLFSYVKDTRCDTADRIAAMTGETPDHWRVDASTTTTDPLLINAMRSDLISFVSELPSNGTTIDAQIHDANDDADDE
jgi:SNF2 family DNA or RNA helicase